VILRISITLLLLLLAGCKRGAGAAPAGPAPAIVRPFQGGWRFNQVKTLALWKTEGVPPEEIALAQKLAASFPMHPDMVIQNEVAILKWRNEGEYRLFMLHPHGPWVCGKAWHHEDRHDPGDMSKCYARLTIQNQDLHLALRFEEASANPNDPDVANIPVIGGSAASCGADAAPEPAWSPWRTYVFDRDAANQPRSLP
jgi:hypothetical protein